MNQARGSFVEAAGLTEDPATVLEVCAGIDGAAVSGFQFSRQATRGDGRHWTLEVRHPELGRPDVAASVEFARRPLILDAVNLPFVELPVHRGYDIGLPEVPVIAEPDARRGRSRAMSLRTPAISKGI